MKAEGCGYDGRGDSGEGDMRDGEGCWSVELHIVAFWTVNGVPGCASECYSEFL